MVMVCAPCLATTLSSIAGPAVAGVGAAAIYKGKKKKPSSKKGKKKPPSKKGKKKPPSKKGKKKPSSKKGKKKPSLKKGGGQYGGICDDCYGEECTDCETNRLRDQEDAKYYLENSFEGDAIKYLEKIQKEIDHPCRDLIELVQDHGNKKINHLKGEGTLSYQDEEILWEESGALKAEEAAYLQDITPGTASANKSLVVDSSKNITGIGTLGATQLNIGTSGTLTDSTYSGSASKLTTAISFKPIIAVKRFGLIIKLLFDFKEISSPW